MNIQIAQVIKTDVGYSTNQNEETGNDLFPGTIKVRISSRRQNTTNEHYASPIDPNDYISNQNDNVLNAKQLTTVLEEKIMKESKKHINEQIFS